MRRPERRRLVVILRRRVAPRPGQQLPIRGDMLHVQPVHHLAVYRPGQPERGSSPTRPLPRRFTRRGVVAHRRLMPV
jgi:hypothetical protein